MTKQIVVYGYAIADGYYIPDQEASPVVQQIFDLYCAGESYNRIADTLNREQVIYLSEHPLWNKHIVKRILENPKYIGTDCYPALIPEMQFQTVQTLIASKTAENTKRSIQPEEHLWPYLTCGTCGGRLYRTGRRTTGKSQVKCKFCGAVLWVNRTNLTEEVLRQYIQHISPRETVYEPSEAVIRLSNAVNRGLEQSEEPKPVIDAILQGISARYQCCGVPSEVLPTPSLSDIDWRIFQQAVGTITIHENDTVLVAFQTDTIRKEA